MDYPYLITDSNEIEPAEHRFTIREYDDHVAGEKYYDLQITDEFGAIIRLDRVNEELFRASADEQQDYVDKTYFGKGVNPEPHPRQNKIVFSSQLEVTREDKKMDSLEQKILNLVKTENPLNPLAYVQDIVQDYARDKMDDYMSKCKECPLGCYNRSTTAGSSNAPLMVIGEMPTLEQVEGGFNRPLEGTEGYEMLQKVFDYYTVNPSKVFYMNAVNCMPYKEIDGKMLARTPNIQELDACKVFLEHAIDIVRPKAILLLGNVALNAFMQASLLQMRGQWLDVKGVPTIATYNPNYFVQIQDVKDEEIIDEYKQDFINDLGMIMQHMQENHPESNLLKEKITLD